ncbi:hypothetical protein BJ085DRAFT_31287 [Dimargaris cristalligena]|uniref:Uncharacterized protein n=1 Tax=Dimargaris cristalligena TaxID=215637 RepID=A0A4V1J5A7_9FUNG|nr:hypothetical protein BJ085DRAFT_31287 [Dimargaris cristalligena]|eukprot:RKP38399.1 hypothetical protein BJ085DRAFT_31287 [Dimargaris cristalligena]
MCHIFSRNRPLAYVTLGVLCVLVAFNSETHANLDSRTKESVPLLQLWNPFNAQDRELLPFANIQAIVENCVSQIINKSASKKMEGTRPGASTLMRQDIQMMTTRNPFNKINDPIGTALQIIHVRWCDITHRYLVYIQRRLSSTERVGGETLTLQVQGNFGQSPGNNGGDGRRERSEVSTSASPVINLDQATEFVTRRFSKGKEPDLTSRLYSTFSNEFTRLGSSVMGYNLEDREYQLAIKGEREMVVAAKVRQQSQLMAFGNTLHQVALVDLLYKKDAGTTVGFSGDTMLFSYSTNREIRAYATTKNQNGLQNVPPSEWPALPDVREHQMHYKGKPISMFLGDSKAAIKTTESYLTGGFDEEFLNEVRVRIADRIDILSKYGFGLSSKSRTEGCNASDEPLQFTMHISLFNKPKTSGTPVTSDMPTTSDIPKSWTESLSEKIQPIKDHFLFRWFTERHLGGTHLQLTPNSVDPLAPPQPPPKAVVPFEVNICNLSQASRAIAWGLSDLFALLMDSQALFGQPLSSLKSTGSFSSFPDADSVSPDATLESPIIFAPQYTKTKWGAIRDEFSGTDGWFTQRLREIANTKPQTTKPLSVNDNVLMPQAQAITNFGLLLYSTLRESHPSTPADNNGRLPQLMSEAKPLEYILMLYISVVKSLPCNPSMQQFREALEKTDETMGGRLAIKGLSSQIKGFLEPLTVE